jgi:mRNA interferase MazF
MKRGDLVTVAMQGDFGKPRPALIIQSNFFSEHPTVTVLSLTSFSQPDAELLRVTVHPSAQNGLEKESQIMIDRTMTVNRDKTRQLIGTLEADTMQEVDRRLAVFLGIVR